MKLTRILRLRLKDMMTCYYISPMDVGVVSNSNMNPQISYDDVTQSVLISPVHR